MQEIVSWCDRHFELDDSRVSAAGLRIGLAGSWKRLDLCQECLTAVLGPLEAVLRAHGRPVAEVAPERLQAPKRRTPLTDEQYERKLASMAADRGCLWCPVVISSYKRLGEHVLAHNFTSLTEAYGTTCPICQQRDFRNLPAHIGKAHNVKPSEAFEWAFYGGDAFARALAVELRVRGRALGAPARTDGAVERVEAAKAAWRHPRG